MREIVLDTETTGLDPNQGDRIVEIGAVELWNHIPTGKTYHQYINPERNMPNEAFQVHGLGDDFLRDKPVFSIIAPDFVEFIADSKLVIHNASFDMRFLNAELSWVKRPQIPLERALDTLAIARKKFPGSPASLDALCRRFGIDNNARTLHGALLDSEILAEVYLELIGGRQPDFMLSAQATTATEHADTDRHVSGSKQRLKPLAPRVSDAEKKAHLEMVATLGDQAMWHDHIWKEQT